MPSTSALPRGTRLHNGTYALGEVLGQGGFGITYKGGDMALKRYVAIKEYFPAGALRQGRDVVMADAVALHRGVAEFLNEARVLGRFQHPGIVGVAGTFEENNTAYMVMEWIEGETLEARIQDKTRLDEWEVTDIGSRLAGALAVVHGAGVLHRDIKPDNVILRRSGGAVLIDFGTARAFDHSATKMTQIVTPGYAPLEQYASNAKRGPASDIYALAATLYHALSGTKPVAATDRAADVPLPKLESLRPGLTPLLTDAIMGALAMEFARRPQSAGEFEAQLKGQKSPARRPPPPIGAASTAATAPMAAPDVAGVDAAGTHAALINSTMKRHIAPVLALAFAPDGKRLISGGADSKICEWNWHDTITPARAMWSAHAGGVLALAYAPDGSLLASGGRDERVDIWDGVNLVSRDSKPLAQLTDCAGVVRDLAFCPARRELAVADAGAVTLWNADAGAIKARRTPGALAIAWSPDGNALAVAGIMDGVLRLWSGHDLSDIGQITAHGAALTGVTWSPDGQWIATTGADSRLRVWHAAQGTLSWEHDMGGLPECVAWSPDSRLVAVGKTDAVFIRTARGAVFRNYTLRRTPGGSAMRGRIEKLRFAPITQAPHDYIIAAGARDYSVDICRIRLNDEM